MQFRHLDYPPDTPMAELGRAAIDALLEGGDLESWAPLMSAIARDPWGRTADTVLALCAAHLMYGTSTLWQTWIEHRRQRPAAAGTTLAEARRRAGLTQTQVAERLGIAQADVSKLERRSDVQLSTLHAYARAINATLQVGVQAPDEDAPRPLVLPVRKDAPSR